MEEKEEVTFIDLNEKEKVFLCLQFLELEEEPCLTLYGKGIMAGLVDKSSHKECPVVLRKDYEDMKQSYEERLNKRWWHKFSPVKIRK